MLTAPQATVRRITPCRCKCAWVLPEGQDGATLPGNISDEDLSIGCDLYCQYGNGDLKNKSVTSVHTVFERCSTFYKLKMQKFFNRPSIQHVLLRMHKTGRYYPTASRTVNNPMFTELCSQEHPGLRAVRNQEGSALRLLQIHVRNRASHARTSSEEVTHDTPTGEADENNEMGEHTEQGKQKVWTDADGHILHRMQVNANCTWDPLYDKYEQNRLKRMSKKRSISIRNQNKRRTTTYEPGQQRSFH